MTDLTTILTNLILPATLTRAARIGARVYDRKRDLRAVLPGATGPRRAIDILTRLMHIEGMQEDLRQSRSAAYSVARHVHILSALLAEAAAAGASRPAQG